MPIAAKKTTTGQTEKSSVMPMIRVVDPPHEFNADPNPVPNPGIC